MNWFSIRLGVKIESPCIASQLPLPVVVLYWPPSTWTWTPTLPDAPLQLRENVSQQDLTERLVKLGEHVADGIQCVVTSCRHPLRFLEANKKKKKQSDVIKDFNPLPPHHSVCAHELLTVCYDLKKTKKQKVSFKYCSGLSKHERPWGLTAWCRWPLTSVCCSGSFMLSKMRKTILKRSCHQCFSKVWP